MAIYVSKEINDVWDLAEEFANYDRDYYSMEGYKIILEYYSGMELDVIGICCECSEYDTDDFISTYEHEETFTDYLIDNCLVDDYCEERHIDTDEFTNDMAKEFIAEYQEEYIEELLNIISGKVIATTLDNGNILVIG